MLGALSCGSCVLCTCSFHINCSFGNTGRELRCWENNKILHRLLLSLLLGLKTFSLTEERQFAELMQAQISKICNVSLTRGIKSINVLESFSLTNKITDFQNCTNCYNTNCISIQAQTYYISTITRRSLVICYFSLKLWSCQIKTKIISKNIRFFFSWRNLSNVITGMKTTSPLRRWEQVWMSPISKSPAWNSIAFSDLGGWAFSPHLIYSLLLIVICKKKSHRYISFSHIKLYYYAKKSKQKEKKPYYPTEYNLFHIT